MLPHDQLSVSAGPEGGQHAPVDAVPSTFSQLFSQKTTASYTEPGQQDSIINNTMGSVPQPQHQELQNNQEGMYAV